jgi:predicted TIM-barrel fold metal-dependent hydrolase
MADREANDQRIYEQELGPWLPPHIIDIHVHVGLAEHAGPVSAERRKAIWALDVAEAQSWEQLRRNYALLFPGRRVSALAFGGVYREVDVDASNRYVLAGVTDQRNDAQGLFITRPEWDAERIAEAMAQGFHGIKPYPDLAPPEIKSPGIFDFLPHPHLATLDELGGILMLHVPRDGRLGDADTIREVLEIADRYPHITLIVPHIGRAYCLPTAQRGLPHFADHSGVYFDTSANLNPDVFQLALETVGPERVLFGTDLPVMMMRGVREYEGEKYINFTDGPYSWNVNRKSPEEEAKYTYYLYEELRALIAAIQRCGMGVAEMEKIMYSNSARILAQVRAAVDK